MVPVLAHYWLLTTVSDDNFDSVADQTVSVTTADDDVQGLRLRMGQRCHESGHGHLHDRLDKARCRYRSFQSVIGPTRSWLTYVYVTRIGSAQTVTVTGADDNAIDGSVTAPLLWLLTG